MNQKSNTGTRSQRALFARISVNLVPYMSCYRRASQGPDWVGTVEPSFCIVQVLSEGRKITGKCHLGGPQSLGTALFLLPEELFMQ